ncbi:hypothetical protein L2E82_30305 [Cichorium intybus]|uniref:Uncharacterized protein n=1 Tax=Cichorium intybus TaxID=13427 RepID=A0ACB9D0G0_CICIN|nr:hypothetical protein L2E82_30305 [Cichorium intybus]
MQTLNGKLTTLGRFIAKSAEKALPLFNTLKGEVSKEGFRWTVAADEAWQNLKQALSNLPTLASPIPGETLSIYLLASHEAISAVLIVERNNIQLPVYFISRALQSPEINYPMLEKLVLALVHAARRLRRYFQAHHIEVLTSQPLKQILLKPENSGRLAKWAIELGELALTYRPRIGIKAQALADFLIEVPDQPAIETPTAPHPPTKEQLCEWTLFTDGAAGKEGSGAGLILKSPQGEEITYALRFDFRTSNNEAEYEALLAGLRLAIENGAIRVTALSDSLLVTNQINGQYEARDKRMQKYTEAVKKLIKSFDNFSIKQIPRSENRRADALSKLASTSFDHLTKKVLVEVLHESSIKEKQVNVTSEESPTWSTPFMEYLQHGTLPEDDTEARKIRVKAPNFAIIEGNLYKKGYLTPWLKCITKEEGRCALNEIHSGLAGAHEGARALTGKILRMGFYWPDIHADAMEITRKCTECQTFSPTQNLPAAPLTSITSPWPFFQWGIDIVGPFPEAPRRVKFLIVAVDYFTKWVEAEPVASITGHSIIKFMWTNILTRFGTPRVLISDNGLQFAENPFRGWCEERQIRQQFTSVAHPQANGQTEVTNHTMVNGIKKRLGKAKGNWVEELPSVLWSYRVTPRTSTQETPFSLVYGSEAMLPPELSITSLRVSAFSTEKTEEDLRHNLDLLEERRELASVRQARYKSNTERYYNRRVKGRAFKVGDLVLRKNEVSHAQPRGKLGPTWEGPYKVVEAHQNGAYVLETMEGNPIPRTWNIQHLKKFHF